MSGDSGTQTPQTQNSTTWTDMPEWYKNQVQGFSQGVLSPLSNQIPDINSMMQRGGDAPQNGVFNGGGTQMSSAPLSSPYPSLPQGISSPSGNVKYPPMAGALNKM